MNLVFERSRKCIPGQEIVHDWLSVAATRILNILLLFRPCNAFQEGDLHAARILDRSSGTKPTLTMIRCEAQQ